MPNSISDAIRARAKAEGFSVVRFAGANADPENAARLGAFLDAGHHGDMAWMAERADDWRHPWPGFTATRYEAKAKQAGRTPCYLVFRRAG